MKKFFIVLLLVAVAFVVTGFLLPSEWKVTRETVINAPAAVVYQKINNLATWQEWTAWTNAVDPSLKRTFQGPPSGQDAAMSWEGDKLGSGKLTITKSDPNAGIEYDLSFQEGEFTSKGSIRLESAANGTRVVWTDAGNVGKDIVGRYFLLMMDKWIGPDFEKGLSKLKEQVEAEYKSAPAAGGDPR